MNAWEPIATEAGDDEARAPLEVFVPHESHPGSPLVFASPHSGRIYPRRFLAAARIDAEAMRRSEDAYVDALIDNAPNHGIPTIAARFARAYVDVNRGPWELDPLLIDDELPPQARTRTARVAAGLGVIARTAGEDGEIYAKKLTYAEAAARVDAVHLPYHRTLAAMVAAARERHGMTILVDWHSMPAQAARFALGGGGCDIVLGDRFGAAASPAISRLMERELRDLGLVVARNAPYAGGYTTEHYGRPDAGVHAVQIEVNRALYVDQKSLTLTAGFAELKQKLERLFARLIAIDWALT